MTKIPTLDKNLDSMRLLPLVYTVDMNDLNPRNNKNMAHMNLMSLYQEKFQDIQQFRDQYVAMQKVCNELGLHFSRCKEDTKAILTEKGMKNPTQEQLKKLWMTSRNSIMQLFLCTMSIGRNMENWWNRWKMRCSRKRKIHYQRVLLMHAEY